MGYKIQVRRGLKKDLPVLDNGELGYTQDTNELFIGTAKGNRKLTYDADKYLDLDHLVVALDIHLDNSENPHNVTAEQTGAYHREKLDELRADLNQMQSSRTSKDDSGIFTSLDYLRADGTLYMKSALQDKEGDNYTKRVETYYDNDGSTVIRTFTFAISYDGDGDWIKEDLVI